MTEVFEARLREIEGSLGIMIPSKTIEEMGFHVGDKIQVAILPSEIIEKNRFIKRLAGVDAGNPPFERDKGDRY